MRCTKCGASVVGMWVDAAGRCVDCAPKQRHPWTAAFAAAVCVGVGIGTSLHHVALAESVPVSVNAHTEQGQTPPTWDMAVSFGAREYADTGRMEIASGIMLLVWGDDVPLALPGTVYTEPAVWWALTPIALRDGSTLGQGDVMGVGGDTSVQCGSGYYACCYCKDLIPVARCRQNANQNDNDCQAGGLGAVSCSIRCGPVTGD